MYRPRRWTDQLPALTLVVLAFGATLHFTAVSSKGTNAPPSVLTAAQPATPVLDFAAPQRSIAVRPVAQLLPPPDGLQSVAFVLDEPANGPENSGGAYRSATGRYTINGHVVLLTTVYADADGSSLGVRQMTLGDGTQVWATPSAGPFSPNQIAFTRGGVIITLAGDLSLDDLTALANRVIVRS